MHAWTPLGYYAGPAGPIYVLRTSAGDVVAYVAHRIRYHLLDILPDPGHWRRVAPTSTSAAAAIAAACRAAGPHPLPTTCHYADKLRRRDANREAWTSSRRQRALDMWARRQAAADPLAGVTLPPG